MNAAAHRIGTLDLRATVSDFDQAMALRPRIEALASDLAPVVIERVCEAIVPGSECLTIPRLDLDLGTIGADHFEEETLIALERSLTEAIGRALHDARHAASAEVRLVSEPDAKLDQLEHYLRSGTVRWRGDAAFDPCAILRALIAIQPKPLTAMLRRLANSRHSLERLVVQAGDGLTDLLEMLAPADAAAILALLGDIVVAHRTDPEPPLDAISEPALERTLWVTTLEFLLRDAGSDFNRRRFLAFLLGREAERLNVEYTVLVRALARSAEQLSIRQGVRSSLPAMLADLAKDIPEVRAAPSSPAFETAVEAALAEARAGRFRTLFGMAQNAATAGDQRQLERLLARLDRATLAELIGLAAPADATTIMATLEALGAIGAGEDGGRWTRRAEHQVFGAALMHLLAARRRSFDQRAFARHLVAAQARWAGTPNEATRAARVRAAEASGGSGPDTPPAILAGLIGDGATPHDEEPPAAADLFGAARALAGDAAAFAAWIDGLGQSSYRSLLRQAGAEQAWATIVRLTALHRRRPLAMLSGQALHRIARRTVVRLALAGHSGRGDATGWWQRIIAGIAAEIGLGEQDMRERLAASLTPSEIAANDAPVEELGVKLAAIASGAATNPVLPAVLAAPLHDAAPDVVRSAITDAAKSPAALLMLGASLSARTRARCLHVLDPVHAEAVTAQLETLARLHAAAALVGVGRQRFGHLIWTLAAGFLIRSSGTRFDAAALARHMLAGLAAYDGISAGRIAARIDAGLEEARVANGPRAPAARAQLAAIARDMAGPSQKPPIADRHRRVAQYLRTGQPIEAGAGLPYLIENDPAWLAAELRRLARATPVMIPLLLERLLGWLMPYELIAALMPNDRSRAARLADALAAGDGEAWPGIFAQLMRGDVPSLPQRKVRIGQHLDETALMAHWLDHGAAPWWATDRTPPHGTFARLAEMPRAALEDLFGNGGTPGSASERLRRAVDGLEAGAASRLLARIAAWATGGNEALRAMLASLAPRQRLDLLLRTATAAIEGRRVDRNQSPEPAPAVPPRPTSPDQARVPVGGEPSLEDLLAWLGGATRSARASDVLARLFSRLLDRRDERLTAYLASTRRDRAARARWATLLPEEALGRLVHALLPARDAGALLDTRRILASAWRRTVPSGTASINAAAWWTMLLDAAVVPQFDLGTAIEQMLARLSEQEDERALLRRHALELASSGGHHGVAAALRRPLARRIVPLHEPAPKRVESKRPLTAPEDLAESPREEAAIYVENAGLVLLAPYLPALFARLGVLTDDEEGVPRIAGIDDASRAVHLLQYLADQRLDTAEPDLVLNKLLCGLPIEQPVLPGIEPKLEDLATCDGLLGAVIANWPIVAGTSLTGLRETFLQREGRLRRGDEGWALVLQRKGVDVLVDQIPWGFAMIYHRWMPEPVQVTW